MKYEEDGTPKKEKKEFKEDGTEKKEHKSTLFDRIFE